MHYKHHAASPQIRNQKLEIRNNVKILKLNVQNCFIKLLFDIRICFVFRYSNLGFMFRLNLSKVRSRCE